MGWREDCRINDEMAAEGIEPDFDDDEPNSVGMSYNDYCEAGLAVQEGRAQNVWDCNICPEGSTLRGEVGRKMINMRQDPTEAIVLTCGHLLF